MWSLLVSVLYYGCFALLLGFALLIVGLPHTRKRFPRGVLDRLKRQRVVFLLLLLTLLMWQATLFVEVHTALPWFQLWLSRVNFVSIAVAAPLLWYFVRLVAGPDTEKDTAISPLWVRGRQVGIVLVVALTMLTPLVVEAEDVVAGVATTGFGAGFAVYLLHVLGYVAATLALIIRARQHTGDGRVRRQLTLIGGGSAATGFIALVCNVLLPFWLGDFRFCDLGTLSTLLFLIAVAYAVFVHGLFDLRVVVGKTLVGGVLLAFVLGGYSSGVFLVTQLLSGESASSCSGGGASVTQFLVLLLTFSFDPLRRVLEKKVDKLLFDKQERRRKGQRGKSKFVNWQEKASNSVNKQ